MEFKKNMKTFVIFMLRLFPQQQQWYALATLNDSFIIKRRFIIRLIQWNIIKKNRQIFTSDNRKNIQNQN